MPQAPAESRAARAGVSVPTKVIMGFYVRKSLRAGPFRFTMSPSGLGVSVGFPGFKVGSGPRGNYVHIGGQGIYYRTTADSSRSGQTPRPRTPPIPPASSVIMEDVTGASVQELVAADPGDLVAQLRGAARLWPVWPFALAALLVWGLVLGGWGLLLILAGVPGVVWLALRDQAVRSVVVMYDVNDAAAVWFNDIVQAVGNLRQAGGMWLITASGAVLTTYQYKTNAGASTINSREAASAGLTGPRHLVTNVAVPTLASGHRAIHFLPDRVLVREGDNVADIPYHRVQLSAESVRVIESETVPRDARIVDRTWQYVNVKGGPDRRYKNNRQLPVLLYGRLTIWDDRGLHMTWDVSRPELAEMVAKALANASSSLPPVIRP